jgi:hypothetical protein
MEKFTISKYNLNAVKYKNSFFVGVEGKRYIKTENKVIIPKIFLQEGKKPDTTQKYEVIENYENIFIWTDHYGDKNICHWFHEQLNGLVLLYNLYKEVSNIKVIVNKNARIKQNIIDVLYFIPNFKKESIYEFDFKTGCKAIKAKNLYLNLGNFNHSFNIPGKMKYFFIESCNIKPEKQNSNKIYISRRKTNGNNRKLINIEEVSEYIIKKGYKEVFMEDLSMKEKLDIIYNSKDIIMEIGAGCINLCFCNKDVNIKIMKQNTYHQDKFYNRFFKPFLYDKKVEFIIGENIKKFKSGNLCNTPWKLNVNKLSL